MLVLGGAAATGAIAIQLGKAVGAYVVTTVPRLQHMKVWEFTLNPKP